MGLIKSIARAFPHLNNKLRAAHLKDSPEGFIKKTLNVSLLFSSFISFFIFMLLSLAGKNVAIAFFAFPILSVLFFMFFFQRIDVIIAKRQRELDKEVLFAGRFLLVKIRSGVPLVNALTQGSESYGVAAKYFKEIVDDINMGTTVEKALENAMKYTPSYWFRKILFQINNALKIGIDISVPLKNTLNDISKYHLLQIQKYGKKLNSLAIFYLLLAVVLPSLGVVMLVVIGSMVGFLTEDITTYVFVSVIFFLIIIQLFFIAVFKSQRVGINL